MSEIVHERFRLELSGSGVQCAVWKDDYRSAHNAQRYLAESSIREGCDLTGSRFTMWFDTFVDGIRVKESFVWSESYEFLRRYLWESPGYWYPETGMKGGETND